MSTSFIDPANHASTRRRYAEPRFGLREHVLELAEGIDDPQELFTKIAADLHTTFGAAIVLLQSPPWGGPIIRSASDDLLHQLDGEVVDALLANATPAPISCDLPLMPTSSSMQRPRALRVELASSPAPVAALIIHDQHHCPSAVKQVEDLRQLRLYAETTRELVANLPATSNVANSSADNADAGDRTIQLNQGLRSLSSFHSSLDLAETCYRITNESRRLLDCDRVTLLVGRKARYRVKSVSGVAVVDRRSNHVRAIEVLARAAAVLDRTLEVPSQDPLPPQVQGPLDHYLDESDVASAVLIPLWAARAASANEDSGRQTPSQDRPLGILVLESFSGVSPAESVDGDAVTPANIEALAGEAGIALGNAIEHSSIFGLTLWKTLGRLLHSNRLPMFIAVLGLVAALLVASCWWSVDHYVVAHGAAEPAGQRDLFAAIDASVAQLHVRDGQSVKEGELLIQLENPELENQVESLAGQIQTTVGRLASIQSLRLSENEQTNRSSHLVLEERQLQSELANLREQQKILRLQLAELSVTSPIDGNVVAWQMERRLVGRPVSRGNLLCTVANPEGPWQLRLTIPERNAGPIIEAAKGDGSLPITFAVATMPEHTFAAELDRLSLAARVDQTGTRVVDLHANVHGETLDQLGDQLDMSSLRVGADVTAKIHCGQRPLIRSWFSDVFDFVHRHILFHFQ